MGIPEEPFYKNTFFVGCGTSLMGLVSIMTILILPETSLGDAWVQVLFFLVGFVTIAGAMMQSKGMMILNIVLCVIVLVLGALYMLALLWIWGWCGAVKDWIDNYCVNNEGDKCCGGCADEAKCISGGCVWLAQDKCEDKGSQKNGDACCEVPGWETPGSYTETTAKDGTTFKIYGDPAAASSAGCQHEFDCGPVGVAVFGLGLVWLVALVSSIMSCCIACCGKGAPSAPSAGAPSVQMTSNPTAMPMAIPTATVVTPAVATAVVV